MWYLISMLKLSAAAAVTFAIITALNAAGEICLIRQYASLANEVTEQQRRLLLAGFRAGDEWPPEIEAKLVRLSALRGGVFKSQDALEPSLCAIPAAATTSVVFPVECE